QAPARRVPRGHVGGCLPVDDGPRLVARTPRPERVPGTDRGLLGNPRFRGFLATLPGRRGCDRRGRRTDRQLVGRRGGTGAGDRGRREFHRPVRRRAVRHRLGAGDQRAVAPGGAGPRRPVVNPAAPPEVTPAVARRSLDDPDSAPGNLGPGEPAEEIVAGDLFAGETCPVVTVAL